MTEMKESKLFKLRKKPVVKTVKTLGTKKGKANSKAKASKVEGKAKAKTEAKARPKATASNNPTEVLAGNPNLIEDVMNAVQHACEGAKEVSMPILRKAIYAAVILGVIGHVGLHQVGASLSGTYTGWTALRKELQKFMRENNIFQQLDADDELQHEEQDDHDEEEAELPQDDDALAKARASFCSASDSVGGCIAPGLLPFSGR